MVQRPDNRYFNTRRMRFKDFNYRTPGYYFVTVCHKDRSNVFARVLDRDLIPTPAGEMVQSSIHDIVRHFNDVRIDCSIVMPNHVHMLMGLNLTEGGRSTESLIEVMNWWKTVTTKRYIDGVNLRAWPRFQGKLWQTGYHDRIVRDQSELEAFRYYIANNPKKWIEDTFFED